MDLLVRVQAQVLQHDQPVVPVGGLAHRRQHDAAGGDSGEDEGVTSCERRTSSRSLPANALTRFLVTTTSPLPRRSRATGSVAGSPAIRPMLLRRAEKLLLRAGDLRMPRAERDAHEHDQDSRLLGAFDGRDDPVEVALRHVEPIKDAVLHVHHE